jgi:ammonia channel protein AmtB
MKIAFQRMSEYVYQLLILRKTFETRSNLKINLWYMLGQTFGEAFIIVATIILYGLVHQKVLANSPVFFAVLFSTTAYQPIRYMVYGFYTMVKGYEAYDQIRM